MKYTTTLIGALSGLTLLCGLPAQSFASTTMMSSMAMCPKCDESADEKTLKTPETLEGLVGMKKPSLWLGSPAPELSIAKFINGDPIDGFEKGQIYVVEFWATWCGPCITAFPHLSELQASYGEKVRFIGVNIWEKVAGQERMDMIEEFVAKQGDRMGYTVAVEEGTSMADNWMKPAGQGGIPAAFIVDGESKIAWIGHPGRMDEPLEAIVAGEYDGAKDAEASWDQQVLMGAIQSFNRSFQLGEDLEKARKIGRYLTDEAFEAEAWVLNAVAWIMLSSEAEGVEMKDYQNALLAAGIACEMTEWKDWGIIDSYAMAMFKTGDTVAAIKWQKKVIELAKDDAGIDDKIMSELVGRLAEYEAD